MKSGVKLVIVSIDSKSLNSRSREQLQMIVKTESEKKEKKRCISLRLIFDNCANKMIVKDCISYPRGKLVSHVKHIGVVRPY